jgi:ankyrin repeat protein
MPPIQTTSCTASFFNAPAIGRAALLGATTLSILVAGCGDSGSEPTTAAAKPELSAPAQKSGGGSVAAPSQIAADQEKRLGATNPKTKPKPAPAATVGATASKAAPPKPVDPAGASPIRFEPDPLDLGEMTADVAKTGTVRIVNTSDSPVTITKAVPGCGCTTLGWPKEPIAPGASADVDITLKPGPKQGVTLRKRVTFQLDGQPSQILQVQGNVAEYVSVKPDILPARVEEEPLSSDIVLASVDGTPFTITSTNPDVMSGLSTEPALVQTVQLDWAAWEEAGRPVKVAFMLDHPKAAQVSTLVKRRSLNARQPNAPSPTNAAKSQINDLSGAARSGDLTRVKLLIADGADPNAPDSNGGRTPLHWAVKGNHIEVATFLLESGADIDKGERAGKTALDFAAESGQVEMTQFLVDAGADVNKRDLIGGNSALWAAGLGTPQTLEILVKANADIEVKDINGLTPLAWAAQTGETQSMQILIDAGADVNVVDLLNGESILMRAARSGKVESVQLLIDRNADTTTKTKMGASTLQIASEYGNVDIVKLLVESGLDPKSKDARGWTALDYAKNRVDDSRFAVIEYLTPMVGSEESSD